MTYLYGDDGVGVLVAVATSHCQLEDVFGLPVQGIDQSEHSAGFVQREVAVVAPDQGIFQFSDGVGVVGPYGGDGLAWTQVLRHRIVQRDVLEGWRAVVFVQNGDLNLKRKSNSSNKSRGQFYILVMRM